jgi:hypothetical protein
MLGERARTNPGALSDDEREFLDDFINWDARHY